MSIEKLLSMPTHEKVEDGYAYNQKYIGKVYQINDQLVYFKEKSTIDFPMSLINTLKSEFLSAVDIKLEILTETISTIEDNFEKNTKKQLEENNLQFKEELITRIDEYLSRVIVTDIDSFKNEINSKIKNTSELIHSLELEISNLKQNLNTFSHNIEEIIDKKLTDVYNSFNMVTKKLVTEAVNEALKDSKRDQSGKLKMGTLMMAKESGLSIDEIIKLSENGLL